MNKIVRVTLNKESIPMTHKIVINCASYREAKAIRGNIIERVPLFKGQKVYIKKLENNTK